MNEFRRAHLHLPQKHVPLTQSWYMSQLQGTFV